MKRLLVLLLITFCVVGNVTARDIKTLSGRIYRNVKVTRVDPTGIAIEHIDGIAFLDFKDLSPELQREFNYVEATYVASQAVNRERDALREMQIRATQAAAAAQAIADQQARKDAATAHTFLVTKRPKPGADSGASTAESDAQSFTADAPAHPTLREIQANPRSDPKAFAKRPAHRALSLAAPRMRPYVGPVFAIVAADTHRSTGTSRVARC